jgi:hypothetical protein
MSGGFSLMPDTPPALLVNTMSTIRIIQKKHPCLVISMFLKMLRYSDQLNKKKFKLEKLQRELIKKNGFTWAKNIYWGNLKQPFKGHNPGLDRTGCPGVYRGAQGSALSTCTAAPPCFTDQMENGLSR